MPDLISVTVTGVLSDWNLQSYHSRETASAPTPRTLAKFSKVCCSPFTECKTGAIFFTLRLHECQVAI